MIWYISAIIFYTDLSVPFHTNYRGGTFNSEERCYRYLNENREQIEKSFTNSFAEYKFEGKTYTMEAFRFKCESINQGIEV